MKINISTGWEDLSGYQQREVIWIINQIEDKNFTESVVKILQVLLMKKKTIWNYLRMRWLLSRVPLSVFEPALQFLNERPQFSIFPKIKGLKEPAPRLGDLSVEQFSICDLLLYRYSEKKDPIILRQLVASLYRWKGEPFSTQNLPKIAEITDKIPEKEAVRIGFIFSSIRNKITEMYPDIFPKPKEKNIDEIRPVFSLKRKYTPFSQLAVLMAADELRLLGNLKECKQTPIYDFFNAFLESKKIHKLKKNE